MHDCWAYTGHCSHYTFVKCNKWETHCNQCPQLNKYPKSFGYDNSFDNFDYKKKAFSGIENLSIVTPSKWLKNEIKKSFLKDYHIFVINNGIDLNVFRPIKSDFRKKYNLKGKKIILGVASVWDERKGLDYFIELKTHLEDNEVIVLVGIKQRKLLDGIITISRTYNPKELAEIYSAADVFLNPTLEDNYPTVNLESIACGTPIIVNDVGGSKETIIGRYGFLMTSYYPTEIIKTIRSISNMKYNYPIKYSDIELNGISHLTMLDNYIKLYGEKVI
jgi:glycosyltransferase involved in cell wall biosynthesis